MPHPSDAVYRFHGHHPPKAGGRTPILAAAPTGQRGAQVDQDGTATLRLYDPIDSWGGDWGVSAKEFADTLDQIPDAQHIVMHINSPGGEVFEGVAILNALRNHPAPVTAVVDGLAASAASFIACGADQLVMGENSQLMIHDAHGICIGNSADMTDLAARLNQLSNNIASIYAAKAGGTTADWRAAMVNETWYSAEEAVAAKLADRVDTGTVDQPTNRFDLTMFTYAGRDKAPTPPIPTVTAGDTTRRDLRARARARQLQLLARRAGDIKAAANDQQDANIITQALGLFTAIDNIVDEAQETLSAYLGVPNPDTDDGDDTAA